MIHHPVRRNTGRFSILSWLVDFGQGFEIVGALKDELASMAFQG